MASQSTGGSAIEGEAYPVRLNDRTARLVRALMLLQSAIALAGLTVKIVLIVNGYTVDWEMVALPPLSIFVLASGFFPAVLSFAVVRRIRWGRGVAIGVEVVISAYSLLASLNRLNIFLMVNLVIAVLVVILLARHTEGDATRAPVG
ncbi:hypothetical protein OHA25_20090 [Nonomuraea sp. NBC_00507]|uniref:hypothetical protein n=1 Tax=Nonomuraea sp. NBC_00507 TaxID=2976002 RepID=UPI002E189BCE